MQSALNDIQIWYASQCDGDWEHSFGIEIKTLDNPGWTVKINLVGTLLEGKCFIALTEEGDQFWLHCRVEENSFLGAGDPTCLERILGIFLEWARTELDWLTIPS